MQHSHRLVQRAATPLFGRQFIANLGRHANVGGFSQRIIQPQKNQVRCYTGARPKNSVETAYHLIFKKNATYLIFIVGSAMVLEATYGWIGDGLWNTLNYGRTYETVDWSKWASPLDDEEDEEEEEGEEEEEDSDDDDEE